MNSPITLEDVIALICESSGRRDARGITGNTLIEDDLGITGDDGCELLLDAEKRFSISFQDQNGSIHGVFGLADDEYLFHSEGINPFGIFNWLSGKTVEKVKPLTVGQFHQAILKCSEKNNVNLSDA